MTSTLICISSGSSKIKKLSWQWGRRWHDGTKAEMGGNDLIWCAYHRTWGKGTGREEADTASRCGEWGRSHSLVFITIDHQLLVRGRNEEEGERLEEGRAAGLTPAWKMHEKSFCSPEVYIHTDSGSPLSPDLTPGSDSRWPSATSCLGKPSPCLGWPLLSLHGGEEMGFLGQTFLITFTAALRSLADSPEKEKSPLDVGPKQGAGSRLARDNWAVVWVSRNGLFGNISEGRRHFARLGRAELQNEPSRGWHGHQKLRWGPGAASGPLGWGD